MDTLQQDVRYALRRLRRAPGFALLAILIIGLGIGGNSAIFSIVNAVLLRPQPYADPDRLVNIYVSDSDGRTFATTSYPEYEEFAQQDAVFESVAAFDLTIFNRTTPNGAEVVFAESTSPGYWQTLGLRPALGRSYSAADATPGSPPVAMLGHAAWLRDYGGDSSIIGRVVRLNATPVSIIGVAPANYDGVIVGVQTEYFLPYASAAIVSPTEAERIRERGSRSTWVKARLRDGATVAQAASAIDLTMRRLAAEYPESNRGRSARVVPSGDVRFHPGVDTVLKPVAALLLLVVALVLAIACSNLANLLLANGVRRRREVSVRLALGARRGQLVRQFLLESLLISLAGGAAGLVVAAALVRAITTFQPPIPLPIVFNFGLDARVLAFTLGLSIVTGLLFGLVPALRASRPDLVQSLRSQDASQRGSRRQFSLRNVLVVSQVSVSMLLLVVSGLFIRSLLSTQRVDPGFESTRAALLTVNTDLGRLTEPQAFEFLRQLQERISARPDVRRVALADRVPLGVSVRTTGISVEGYQPPAGQETVDVDYTVVGPGYLATLGIPLLAGREFTDRDDAASPRVVVVSEALARRFWETTDVVGKRFRLGGADGAEVSVVGLTRDTRVRTFGESPRPFIYASLAQDFSPSITIVAATVGSPEPVLHAMREASASLNVAVPVFDAKTMTAHLGVMMFVPRMGAALMTLFGVLAVSLALLGLYGVVSFAVSQRTREMGIRIAVGASAGQVMSMVVGEGLRLVAIGGAIGLLLATAVSGPLSSALYGVPRLDVSVFTLVSLLFATVAALASAIPGHRAARVQPVVALKHE